MLLNPNIEIRNKEAKNLKLKAKNYSLKFKGTPPKQLCPSREGGTYLSLVLSFGFRANSRKSSSVNPL